MRSTSLGNYLNTLPCFSKKNILEEELEHLSQSSEETVSEGPEKQEASIMEKLMSEDKDGDAKTPLRVSRFATRGFNVWCVCKKRLKQIGETPKLIPVYLSFQKEGILQVDDIPYQHHGETLENQGKNPFNDSKTLPGKKHCLGPLSRKN